MNRRFKAAVLTISDKGARGMRHDESGETVCRMLEDYGLEVVRREIVPDDQQRIAHVLMAWADTEAIPLIVTSGGTGLSPADVTPQAMGQVIDYPVPGMAEAMRAESLKKTPHAMISRAMAGVRKGSLIINLPGSPRGAAENLSVVLPALEHALSKLGGDPTDCAAC
ncbi:MAG: molybdenum cofactor biosynthesis protein [Desulfococcus sp. 4484_242]|nr:MAG: molybdenum cofactor biosynthesis protein [Desulfococcus sp. 4484_242]